MSSHNKPNEFVHTKCRIDAEQMHEERLCATLMMERLDRHPGSDTHGSGCDYSVSSSLSFAVLANK